MSLLHYIIAMQNSTAHRDEEMPAHMGGHYSALLNHVSDHVPIFCSRLHMRSQKITGAQMHQAKFFHKLGAL